MVKIITLPPDRWSEYKKIRLEAVTNEPLAFAYTREEELKKKNYEWVNQLKKDSSGYNKSFFAEYNGQIVGMVSLSRKRGEKIKHVGHIYSFYVSEYARGEKIGEKLLDHAITFFKNTKEVMIIELVVTETQKNAKRLYKKTGFVETGIHKMATCKDDKYYDWHIMSMVL